MRLREALCAFLLLGLIFSLARPAAAQVNSVDLAGQVLDPNGLSVGGATVTVENLATGASRSVTTDSAGQYKIVGLPPGRYKVTIEAKGFAKLVNPEIVLTIGQAAEFNASLQIAAQEQTVTVTGATELIETTKTAVSETVNTHQIDNLPINGRNYINFTLLDSRARRDDAPSIGAAPTSGINFQGQRARSNEVSVDGADAVDNSVNGIRSTVSQEAVQEFQIIDSVYMPEFGRASGGVINIVTKSGSNEMHGNVYGYLRNKAIQARNPFSVQIDPATGNAVAVKQGYTRVQAGATLGGPIQKDKTFYFFAFETTRREETGFTDIGVNNFGFGSTPAAIPCVPVPMFMTPSQAAFYQAAIPAAGGCASPPAGPLIQAAVVTGAASAVAMNGTMGPLAQVLGIPAAFGGKFFPLPVPGFSPNPVPLPGSFVALNSLRGNYPIKEKTQIFSLRLDHIWNARHSSFLRVNVSPSFVTGIQVNAQNQNFGQNAASRTSLNRYLDHTVVAQTVSSLSDNVFNEARFQFARRGLHYGFAEFTGGDQTAVNITGFAFFGREPFSTVDRIERRFQGTDNVTWIKGHHTFKTGVDFNLVQVRSKKPQVFELDFGGLYNFGSLSPNPINSALPAFTAIQAYGLGLPSGFDQGVGAASQPFDTRAVGAFFQDSWKIFPRLTMNYGLRYDIELTPQFQAATQMNQVAEPAIGVIEGVPVFRNAWQPRIGFAWDPWGDGKTVVRTAYGIYFDHPLLALEFDSTTADGARSVQLEAAGGAPSGVAVTPATAASTINAASFFQGVLGGPGAAPGACGTNIPANFGFLCQQQRFNPFLANSIFTSQNFISQGFPLPLLPFVLPTARDFVFAYAQQAGLSIEREIFRDFKLSVSYSYTHGVHLNRPRDINSPNPAILLNNFRNFLAAGQTASGGDPRGVVLPTSAVAATAATCGITFSNPPFSLVPGVLGMLTGCPGNLATLNGQFVGTAGFFNFFRNFGPNPSFASLLAPGFPAGTPFIALFGAQQALAKEAGFPVGIPGVPVPFGAVDQQESSGNSLYHGLTISLSKRFSHHVEMLSSYTWSHAIDDSADLQTLLEPQDDRFPNLERSSSTFDQRHRWVTSAVLESPYRRTDDSWVHKFLSDFTVSPIIEVASGRPFTVLSGQNFNLNFGNNTNRPGVVPIGTPGSVQSPFIHNVAFFVPTSNCATVTLPNVNAAIPPTVLSPPVGCDGNLGRNAFVRPGFFSFDLRISRKIFFGERTNLEIISEAFNLFNRFNAADVNPLCNPLDPASCQAGQVTAALDPRQFQFALKVNF